MIRECLPEDFAAILEIINQGAEAYRAFIPPAEWTEPYMPAEELRSEIAAGVRFMGYETNRSLVGVMGLQVVRDVALIRHAYVLPKQQRCGIGSGLLRELRSRTTWPMLLGTWEASSWAISFYEKHGFRRVPESWREALLRKYWSVPDGQIAASMVLADAGWWSEQRL